MKVKYYESQDIDIILTDKEFEKLSNNISEDFFNDTTLRVLNLEAMAYFYLGHCENSLKMMAYAYHLDGEVQLVVPEEQEDSYFINLLPKAINQLKKEKLYSARYPGGSKLSIKINDAMG